MAFFFLVCLLRGLALDNVFPFTEKKLSVDAQLNFFLSGYHVGRSIA